MDYDHAYQSLYKRDQNVGRHLQDHIGSPSTTPTAVDDNHAHSESQGAQPGIYADLDITGMDYEHAYQPLYKRSQNVTTYQQVTSGPPSTTPTVADNDRGQKERPGIYEDSNDPPCTTAACNKNLNRPEPQGADTGFYEDHDDTDVDYDYAYQHLDKRGRVAIMQQSGYQNSMLRGKASREDKNDYDVPDNDVTKTP